MRSSPTATSMEVVSMATLTPAYGRDYKSQAEVEADFRAGKDFILNDFMSQWDGKPCSIRDFPAGTQITLRYKKKSNVIIVTI